MRLLTQWFGMHGYAPYIWSAYGLVFCALIANMVSARWRYRCARHQLRLKLKRF